ncbi:MAG: beta strand repeat-containing protein, partial [Candidatus Bathyarchaeia archaeon]
MAGNDVYLDTLYPTNDVGLYDPTTAPLNIPVAPLGAQASTSVGIVSLTSSRIDVPVSGVQLIASAGSVTATTPITWVQGHILNNQGGLTLPLTGSVIQSGSTVVGAVTVAVSQTLVSVTDDKGNSYTIFDHTTDSRGQENYAFILGNITNGPSTITATFTSSSAGFTGLIWDEYSGVAALTDPRDGHVVNLQQNPITVATDAITSTPITTTINGDLIWGATINSNNSDSPVAGTGFTSRERDGTGAPMNSEDMVQTTAGSVAATFTPPTINGSQTTFVVALKPAISKTVVVTGVQANTAAGTAIGTNITFVQNATNGAISATTIAATGSVVGTGGCIAGAVSWGSNTIALSSVIDDKGNSYTISDNFADASTSQCMATFVRGNITNGPSTLTATFGSSATFVQLSWNEYSGVVALTDPRDGHTGQIQTSVTSTSADAITSGNITTTSNGDLIFAATMDDSGINPSAGTGFNLRVANNSGGNVSIALEDLIQVTAGTANGTFTQASQPNPWITAVMALKPAAAASGTSVNITGVAGTTSAGTVFANVQPNANGAQANSSAGILFANVQYTITGVQANSASGLLFANVQVTANGVQANSAAGTLTSNLQITITGAQANAQAGTATVVIGTNVNLTGVQANAQAGTVSVTGTANVAVTGVQANGQAGIVTANVQTLPAGVQANGAAGIVTANIAKTLTGVQPNSAAGLLFANVQYTIVGVQANAAAGIVTLSLSSSSNVSITGVQANAQAGTVTIITGSAVNVTGVQANAQAGSTTETGTANVAITGVQANSQIGTAIANVGSIILGSQANAQAGTVTLSINAFISGVQANSAA